jgi:RimJ/RimL family protein N-acetyltransferase
MRLVDQTIPRDPGTTAEPPTLAAGDAVLRPWRWNDAPALLAACQDPEIARWAAIPQPFGVNEAFAFLDEGAALWRHGSGASFAIADAATDALLGAITRFGPDGHRATLGCWVAAAARGRGVGTAAIRAITAWTFAVTEVTRVEAFILAGNEPSHRMMARAGFTREGTLRAWDLGPDGRPADCVSWSRLREER